MPVLGYNPPPPRNVKDENFSKLQVTRLFLAESFVLPYETFLLDALFQQPQPLNVQKYPLPYNFQNRMIFLYLMPGTKSDTHSHLVSALL